MLRLRRYRVFVVFAVVALGLFYHFKGIGYTQSSIAASVSSLKHATGQGKPNEKAEDVPSLGHSNDRFNDFGVTPVSPITTSTTTSSLAVARSTSTTKFDTAEEAFEQLNHGLQRTKSLKSSSSPLNGLSASRPTGQTDRGSLALAQAAPTSPSTVNAAQYQRPPVGASNNSQHMPKGETQEKVDDEAEPTEQSTLPKIHWSKISEHFPVPTQSLITIPTGVALGLPKIQYDFDHMSDGDNRVEQDKLDAIKASFQFSWAGYREKAWMQDELSPKTGKYRNPFCGWGATLVDSLDTLWLMDLTDDFEIAVDAVKDIDFTTSSRNDIPLFETVIRYLGGLIGAYDISGGKYEVLLAKAIELAEVLMGAFDTPNRMPMTFYLWKPTFASQPHRAKTRVVMAELGSLSLEFTRLAQITKEAKYYDAIARITNELALWQNNTKIPGLWPLKIDASGCRKPEPSSSDTGVRGYGDERPSVKDVDPPLHPEAPRANEAEHDVQILSKVPATGDPRDRSINSTHLIDDDEMAAYNPRGRIEKREISDGRGHDETAANSTTSRCDAQGLASPPYSTMEEFSLGGLADSTYEYLPKEYILLGGLEPKYRTMYEMATEAAKKHLLYRPMIRDANRSVLQAGLLKSAGADHPEYPSQFLAEGTHLTCFAGGMYALGSKVFGRQQDLDVASKLTDGCVWAYEATKTGIMPETFSTIPCKETESCAWNETLWLEALGPYHTQRPAAGSEYSGQHVLSEDESRGDDLAGLETPHSDNMREGMATSLEASKLDTGHMRQHIPETSIKGVITEGTNQTHDTLRRIDTEDPTRPPSLHEKHEASVSLTPSLDSSNPAPNRALRKRQLGEVDNEVKPLNPKDPQKAALANDDPKVGQTEANSLKDVANDRVQKDVSSGESKSKLTAGADDHSSATKHITAVSKETSDLEPTKTVANLAGDSSIGSSISSRPASVPPSSLEGSPTRKTSATQHSGHEELPLGMTKIISSRYLLRPEAIESVFIMYRITGNQYWRTKGWEMFQAIEKHTTSTFGASAISDVNEESPKQLDEMESFWLAETLKYFYLLFSDPHTLSLDDYVLNTEAHPLKRQKNG